MPLDHSKREGEQIELRIARLKSTAPEPAQDAFVMINGGPGASSIDMLVDFGPVADAFTRERDVVVIDQRGTGRSAVLNCPGLTDSTEELDDSATVELTQECLAQLPYDPRYFTTTVAVQDLETVREALGYAQFSLYGVSYGTRVVQQYLRMFPDSARVAVIDGVVPSTQALGTMIAAHSQQAFDQVLARCAADPACNEAFPDLKQSYQSLASRLKEAPVPLTLRHPVTGKSTDIELTFPHLMMWLRLSLYAPETTAIIPLTLHQAFEGDYLPIAANALRLISSVTGAMSYGMHNAVMCSEDAPFFNDDEVDFDAMRASYMGEQMYETLKQICSVWPEGVIDPNIKSVLKSDVPTLVLSGEFDPITPPAWGEVVLPGLSQAKHIVAPGQGHGVLPRGCMPLIVREFVEKASVDDLDTECVKHLGTYPFFVDAMGPPP